MNDFQTQEEQKHTLQHHEEFLPSTKSHAFEQHNANNKRPMIFDHDSDKESTISTKTERSDRKLTTRNDKKRKKHVCVDYEKSQKKHKLMNELFQGVFIYAICVSAPVILGVVVKWYEHYFVSQFASHSVDDYYDDDTQHHDGPFDDDQSESLNQRSLSSTFMEQMCNIITKLMSNIRNHNFVAAKLTVLLSSYSKDVQFIIIAAIIQSIIRVILVHLLVPRYLAPKRMIAFVRNKSTHLLSSTAYQWSSQDSLNKNHIEQNSTPTTVQRQLSRRHSVIQFVRDTLEHGGHSFRRSLGHETKEGLSPGRPRERKTMRPTDFDNLDATQALRLFAAPRYATAVFRLMCCTVSCVWALIHFRKALYWPVWVGGSISGKTKYCWDLSGTVDASFVWKLEMMNEPKKNPIFGDSKENINHGLWDLDFDNQNSALRYFFLGQASYQLQSLCFHFLSMIILIAYGGIRRKKSHSSNEDNDDGLIISARSSFKSYFRPVMEHMVYFLITMTIFFFSALRRLGSISIFAQEVSSLMLQLLQICINAPETSILHRPKVIRFVHHYLAIPVFVYCRLFIIPFVVQYSAIFESTAWLRQIDHAFLPGCGNLIYYFYNGTLILTLFLNFIYLRRLIFHPYIKNML
jgi:hypothetical protein